MASGGSDTFLCRLDESDHLLVPDVVDICEFPDISEADMRSVILAVESGCSFYCRLVECMHG